MWVENTTQQPKQPKAIVMADAKHSNSLRHIANCGHSIGVTFEIFQIIEYEIYCTKNAWNLFVNGSEKFCDNICHVPINRINWKQKVLKNRFELQ